MSNINFENITELMDGVNFGNSISNGMPNAGPYIKDNSVFGFITTNYSKTLKYKITLSKSNRPHRAKLALTEQFDSSKWFSFKTFDELETYITETVVKYDD